MPPHVCQKMFTQFVDMHSISDCGKIVFGVYFNKYYNGLGAKSKNCILFTKFQSLDLQNHWYISVNVWKMFI